MDWYYKNGGHGIGTANYPGNDCFNLDARRSLTNGSLTNGSLTNVGEATAAAAAATATAAAVATTTAVTGGINTVLEYDISNMSTFISWCSFSILKQSRIPNYEFEQSIKSVLFATRLPKSTIIIALEYINQRYSGFAPRDLSNHDIFIKIITSFILANKFNDDNTFTNKSWFGATGLSLQLLNTSETDWLNSINWNLNVVKFELNINTLLTCWDTWLLKYGNKQCPTSPLYSPCMNFNNNYSYVPLVFDQQQQQQQNYQPPPPPQQIHPQPYPGPSVILPYPTQFHSYNYQYYPSPLSPVGDIYHEKYNYHPYNGYNGYTQTMLSS